MELKQKQLNIRISAEDKEKIQSLASDYGLDLSSYLRLILITGRLPPPKK